MFQLAAFLAQHGLMLLVGSSVLLTAGCCAMLLSNAPAFRRQLGELTLFAVAAWLLLALIPLPRWLSQRPAIVQAPAPPTKVVMVLPRDIELENVPAFEGLEATIVEELPSATIVSPRRDPLSCRDEISLHVPPVTYNAQFGNQAAISAPVTPQISPADRWRFAAACSVLVFAVTAAAWVLLGQLLLLRLRLTAQSAPAWLTQLSKSCAQHAPATKAALLIHPRVRRPLAWGIFAPVILLPESLCRRENSSQLQAVLLHEWGHIVHNDARGSWLLSLTLPLVGWHPLYWWLRREMNLAAELVADDWAAQHTDKEAYVENLVALAQEFRGSELPLLGAVGVFSVPSQFFRRMEMLLARDARLAAPGARWQWLATGMCLMLLGLSVLLVGVEPLPAQDAPEAKPPTPPAAPAAPTAPVAPTAPTVIPVPATGAPTPPTVGPPTALPGEVAPPKTVPATPAILPPTLVKPPMTVSPEDGVIIRRTLDERDQLLEKIKLLEDRVRALQEEAQKPTRNPGFPAASAPLAPLAANRSPYAAASAPVRTITLIREEDGKLSRETWTLDVQGRPDKVIERTELKGSSGYSIVPTSNQPMEMKREVEVKEVNGEYRMNVYELDGERKRSKLVESRPLQATPPVEAVVREQPPIAAVAPQLATAIPGEVATVGSARQLDLVNLATSYADALGALDAAKAKLAELEPLAKSNVVSQQELTSARIAVQSAQRKESILRRIAETALAAAKEEHNRLAALHAKGNATSSATLEAQSRVDILQQILGSNTPGDAKPATGTGLPSR